MSKGKPTACFIDHSYHRFTKSTQFLIDLFESAFSLKVIDDHNWKKGNNAEVSFVQYPEFIIYCQVIPEPEHLLEQSKKAKIIWIPMYDALITSKNKAALPELSKIDLKVICFSKKLFSLFKQKGFNTIYTQYYLPSDGPLINYSKKNVYFWYRRNPINWNLCKQLLKKTRINSIVIKNDPDIGWEPLDIENSDITKFNIKVYGSQLDIVEHNKILNSSNIFIAPRQLEGIGMSLVESLARGQCVVAANNPTMNEYIQNGINGILYDLKNPRPLNLENFRELGKKARELSKNGYQEWKENSSSLIRFVLT